MVYPHVQWARMGKVVKLDAAAKERGKSGPAAKQRKTGRRRRSKTALVLGGGGFTGGVYEIGALRALDLLSVNRTVNQFDVYVGTSAGSFVAAHDRQRRHARGDDAGGQPAGADAVPRRRRRHAAAPEPPRVRAEGRCDCRCAPPASLRQHGRPARPGLGHGPRARPRRGAAVGHLLGQRHRALRAPGARPTPTAPTTSACSSPSCTSPPPTSTPASGSCSAPRTGTTCPISTAVRASTALPMVYKPVEVKDRELVDGGIVSTTNLDIAVEAGAKFVVVVNPLVPYVNDFDEADPDAVRLARAPGQRHGLPADRLPGVQAAGLPAPARDGAPVGGALPGRRHRADRARAQRRADVPDARS